MKKYTKNLYGIAAILLGAFFCVEHIYSYGRLDFYDFLGHEWLGIILIIVGIILNISFKRKGVD